MLLKNTVSLDTILLIGAEMVSDLGENPEYDRAVSEFAAMVLGLSVENTSAALLELMQSLKDKYNKEGRWPVETNEQH